MKSIHKLFTALRFRVGSSHQLPWWFCSECSLLGGTSCGVVGKLLSALLNVARLLREAGGQAHAEPLRTCGTKNTKKGIIRFGFHKQ